MKSKDEAVLSTLRSLIDAVEALASRQVEGEDKAVSETILGELSECRAELAESFELNTEL